VISGSERWPNVCSSRRRKCIDAPAPQGDRGAAPRDTPSDDQGDRGRRHISRSRNRRRHAGSIPIGGAACMRSLGSTPDSPYAS
jgi:hypothetical protein